MAASATTVATPTANRRPCGPRPAQRPVAAPVMATAPVQTTTRAAATTNNRRRKRRWTLDERDRTARRGSPTGHPGGRSAARSVIGEAIADAVHREQVAGLTGV